MATGDSDLTIRGFLPGDEIAFRRLNQEWILRHFAMEAKDEEALADPRRHILDRGGRIFVAVAGGETVGCCALCALGPGEYELAKMAVTESLRGAGIGRRLLAAAIEEARLAGAARVYLETNRKLEAAVRLYESMGFRHLPSAGAAAAYGRTDVFMELTFDASGFGASTEARPE